jgi:hypothetical protein
MKKTENLMQPVPRTLSGIMAETSTVLMSDTLDGQVPDLEELGIDEEELQRLEKQTKTVIIRTHDKENVDDMILGSLKAIGISEHVEGKKRSYVMDVEVQSELNDALGLLTNFTDLEVPVVEVHVGEQVTKFRVGKIEATMKIVKCNLYDISMAADMCTLVVRLG